MNSEIDPKQSRFSLRKRLKSFNYAFNGIKVLIQTEHNARIHLFAALLVNILGVWLGFTVFEWIAIWLCIGLVFMAEIFNTAIENLCDHLSKERNPNIGRIKDLAAAGVLVAALTSVIVLLFVVIDRYLAVSLVRF